MQVELVTYTQGNPAHEHTKGMNLEELICYKARVSNPSSQVRALGNSQLIRYLIEHKHWSPFAMADATLEIRTTRDIGRQVLRHKSFDFQEYSQRYADVTGSYEMRECRLEDPDNRQKSLDSSDRMLDDWWVNAQQHLMQEFESVYSMARARGIAKEVARSVLPEGMTPTIMEMKGNMRSWIHYIQVRTEGTTQKEHRDLALACAEALKPVFPLISSFVHKE